MGTSCELRQRLRRRGHHKPAVRLSTAAARAWSIWETTNCTNMGPRPDVNILSHRSQTLSIDAMDRVQERVLSSCPTSGYAGSILYCWSFSCQFSYFSMLSCPFVTFIGKMSFKCVQTDVWRVPEPSDLNRRATWHCTCS